MKNPHSFFRSTARLAFIVISGVMSCAAFAQAQGASSVQEINPIQGQVGWNVVTTNQGCIAYLRGAFFNDQKSIVWSGSCQRGRPITGNGVLTFFFEGNDKVTWTGQFARGFLNGRVKFHSTMSGGADETYAMGCVATWGPSCMSTRPSHADTTSPVAQAASVNAAAAASAGITTPKVSGVPGQASSIIDSNAALDGTPAALARPATRNPVPAGNTDPLSAYALCVTAVYAELIGHFTNPTEIMAHSRIACDAMRSALESDVRQVAGSATSQVMLGVDVAILKELRAAFK